MDARKMSERGDKDTGSGTTISLRSRSSGTSSQQNISMNSLNEGMIHVYNYTSKDYVKFARTMKCEEICIEMCRLLNIRPVVQLLFGICDQRQSPAKSKSTSNTMSFWALPGEFLVSDVRYCFRMRFRMPDLENQLRFLDPESFNYLYYQMRYDVVHEQISEIRYPDHKDEVLGLAVMDMRIDLEVQSLSAEAIQGAYKSYLPRSLWHNHFVFIRSQMQRAFQDLIASRMTFAEFKFHYISFVCSLAPTYMMEQYRAIVEDLPYENFNTLSSEAGSGTISPSTSTSTSKASVSGGSIRTNGTLSTTTLSTLANGVSCNGLATETSSGTAKSSASTSSSSRKTKIRNQKKVNDTRPKGIDVLVRLWPHESAEPGLKVARVTSTPKWSLVALTEDIIMISPSVKEPKVSLDISGMQRGYDMYFETDREMKSFVSYLGIYMRMTGIWMRDLCHMYKTPSLIELRQLSLHGPIGGAFSLMKLHEKNDICGSYIVRQCDREYYTYYIDINIRSASRVHNNHAFKTETFKIIRVEKQEKQWILVLPNGAQNAFATLNELALSIHTDGPDRRCIPPSLHDKYPLLLLCLPKNLKNKKTDIELTDCELRRRNPQIFNPSKDLQCYPGTCDRSNDNIMYAMRGDWIQKGSIKDVPVTLKILRSEGDSNGDFIGMTEKWGFIESPQFLKLYGITLANPLTMVMEYSNYGPFDRFLRLHPKIGLSLLIKVMHGFSRGMHYLAEYGIIHNFIRCSNLYVTDFNSNGLVVKIGDPGYPRLYRESDCAWIPTKYYNNLEAAKIDRSAQIWAFATTVYEIFSRCREDLRRLTQANLIQNRTQFGNILAELDPQLCPSQITETIMDGWSDDAESQFQLQIIVARLSEIDYECIEITDMDLALNPAVSLNGHDDNFGNNGAWGGAHPLAYEQLPCVLQLNDCKVRYNKNKDIIGEGRYGKVFKGWMVLNDGQGISEEVAIKELHTRNVTEDFLREMSIMQTLDHPNVVKFKSWSPSCKAIIMEFLTCSFETFLRSHPSTPRKLLESFALDIAKGMDYLADNKIIHRDLAARNVLVDLVMNRVKISDFGLSQRQNDDGYYIGVTERHLPIKWYSPEAIRHHKHSLYSDIWSYGVTLFETFSRGAAPDLDPMQLSAEDFIRRLEGGERLPRPQPANACADFVYHDIMLPCWNPLPRNRPTFKMIIDIFRRETDVSATVSDSSQQQQQLQYPNHANRPQAQQNGNNIENDQSFRLGF